MSPSATLAHIKPDVLRWARESAGYELRDAADAIGIEMWQLDMIEAGSELLTLRQAEKAAEVYGRPLATLFVPEPPAEEPQEVQFRRLPGTPEPPWGPEIQLTARRVMERQRVAREVYEALEESPPWRGASRELASIPRDDLADAVRELLGVSRAEQASWTQDDYASFRGWREAVERLGVLVMQAGPVGVQEMRGFASVEPPDVPAILVNNKDDPRARAFTVIHELGHLVLARRGELAGHGTERWCDEFAGQVIMPETWLREAFASAHSATTLGRVHSVAKAFHVTPLAAAVRVTRAGLVPADEGGAVIGHIRARSKPPSEEEGQKSGNYYVTQLNRFGPGYLRLVFSALDNEVVTLPAASALLGGMRVKYFAPMRDRLEGR